MATDERDRFDPDTAGAAQLDLGPFAVGQARLVTGARTGALLGALADAVASRLAVGARPEDVLVVCASPQAALAVGERLARELGRRGVADAERVRVTSAREEALAILATPEAQAATGRRFSGATARVLAPYERDILFEDLKTWGTRPGRLRKMLDFMDRGLTELADEDPSWLFTVEEVEVRKIMVDSLRYLGAVVEPEVSNLATKALRADAALRARRARPHVLAFGYQAMSRASQLLCHLLAGASLEAFANPGASTPVFESYPYAAGVEEFARIDPGAARVDFADPGVAVRPCAWDDPDAECAGIADLVAGMTGRGSDPSRIAVVCHRRQAFSQVARALRGRGLEVCGLFEPLALRGDFAQPRRSLAMRVATVLRLLANGRDGAAWRCWMGFDDELAHSAEFKRMREDGLARDGGALLADDVAGWEGYAATERYLESCRGMTGPRLLRYLVWSLTGDERAELPAQLAPLQGLGAGADAAQMVSYLERAQLAPCYAPGRGVTVCGPAQLEGQSFDCVILAGFVNGTVPAHDYFDLAASTVEKRRRMEERDAAHVAHLRAAADGELVVSAFGRVGLDEAQRDRLKVDRIAVDPRTGAQMAEVSPSILADRLR